MLTSDPPFTFQEEIERHRRLIQLAEEEKRMVEKRAASEEFHRRRTNSDLDRTVGDLQSSLRHLQAELKKKNEQVQHLSTSQSVSCVMVICDLSDGDLLVV